MRPPEGLPEDEQPPSRRNGHVRNGHAHDRPVALLGDHPHRTPLRDQPGPEGEETSGDDGPRPETHNDRPESESNPVPLTEADVSTPRPPDPTLTEVDPLGSAPVPLPDESTWAGAAERSGEDLAEVLHDFEPPSGPGLLGRLGRYDIIEQIGQGSMGLVFKARDTDLNRVVAIKMLSAPGTKGPEPRQRFLREAKAAAAVHHDHVVTIFAVEDVRGRPYLVMHYVDGISLQDLIDRQQSLPPSEVIRIGREVAAGLAAAHARGLIHRDIKPSNILLERSGGRARITDFGLARAVDDGGLSQHGLVSGTPSYMAPEQARGERVDHRADLFSLGGVLYAMCTGRAPFRAEATMAVLRRVCEGSPEPIPALNPDVPAGLVAVIARLHAKDPADRFQSADEVAKALANVPLDGPSAAPSPATAPAGRGGRLRGRGLVAAAGAALLGLGVLACCEVAGVSHVVAALAVLMRVRTADGTLVLEVDDPSLRVTVQGDGEEIVIQGAGEHEIRLRPGRHALHASRDGVKVLDDLVTISRGDRRVLTLGLEPARTAARPAEAAPRRRGELTGHAGAVHALAFSPDGRRLASASFDKTIRVWDVGRQGAVRTLKGHEGNVLALAFSADGETLASGSQDATVRLWDCETGLELARLPGHTNWVWSVAFSPDGKTLASAGADFNVRLWDVASRAARGTLSAPGGVHAVAFSPDGEDLALGLGWAKTRTVQVWSVAPREVQAVLEGHRDGTNSVAFSPDGKLLATAGNDRLVRLWQARSWTERRPLTGHERCVTALAFSRSGKTLISGDGDFRFTDKPGQIKLWEVDSGRALSTFPAHASPIYGMAASPDGTLLASGADDTLIRLWELGHGGAPTPSEGQGPEEAPAKR